MAQIKVQIFLSTYNGERYLKAQIDSLLNQQDVEVGILVRDDGSTDRTCEILKQYEEQGKLQFYKGCNLGYAESFLDLIKQDVYADYYAFCDQDDVWLSTKLICAVQKINDESHDLEKPLLYASALQRVDKNLNRLSIQNFRNLKLSLGAEFTRHRLAGCSFVFNNTLRNLIKKTNHIPTSHDKLATILCLACGGQIIYDSNTYILFRRHGDNTSSDSKSKINKIKKDLKKYLYHKNQADKLASFLLSTYREDMLFDSIVFLSLISSYKCSLWKTIKLAFSSYIDCGFWYYNYFVRAMILLHYY
ncbi:glycosyltransferase [Megasphaera elsdenii]|uniref:glycosyltransferase n=1 Tax=Megasphaera elsdenii TaxID=907 RepID=UPI00266F0D30|nr:glycosyltransferase [Megasphaera elsdenii]